MAFKDELKKYVDLAVGKSVIAFGKGKAAVSKFGDDSATRIEIFTFGKNVLRAFEEDKQTSVSSSDELIAASLRTIAELKADIARKEELLQRNEKDEEKSEQTSEADDSAASDTENEAEASAEDGSEKKEKKSKKNAKKDD